MRRFFLGFLALLMSIAVASCGGGGGYDGETGPNNSLRMAPLLSDVGLSVGYEGKITTISQGVKPYYPMSSDPSVSVAILEDGSLVLRGNQPGTSTVSIQDSSVNQTTLSMSVTVSAPELTTSLGDEVTVQAGTSRQFFIRGGVAPYVLDSNNGAVATATIQNTNVVTLMAFTRGTATLRITDSVGTTKDVTVNVDGADLAVSPSVGSGQPGEILGFTIVGGVAPYAAATSAPAVASVLVVGDTARVTLGSTQGNATLTFKDATGQSFVVEIANQEVVPALRVSPGTGIGLRGDRVTLTVLGGRAPYNVYSSNASIASVPSQVNGPTITVTLNREGNTTITVVDSRNQSVPVTITVEDPAPEPEPEPEPTPGT